MNKNLNVTNINSSQRFQKKTHKDSSGKNVTKSYNTNKYLLMEEGQGIMKGS